jgi:hypothetical protein
MREDEDLFCLSSDVKEEATLVSASVTMEVNHMGPGSTTPSISIHIWHNSRSSSGMDRMAIGEPVLISESALLQ